MAEQFKRQEAEMESKHSTEVCVTSGMITVRWIAGLLQDPALLCSRNCCFLEVSTVLNDSLEAGSFACQPMALNWAEVFFPPVLRSPNLPLPPTLPLPLPLPLPLAIKSDQLLFSMYFQPFLCL